MDSLLLPHFPNNWKQNRKKWNKVCPRVKTVVSVFQRSAFLSTEPRSSRIIWNVPTTCSVLFSGSFGVEVKFCFFTWIIAIETCRGFSKSWENENSPCSRKGAKNTLVWCFKSFSFFTCRGGILLNIRHCRPSPQHPCSPNTTTWGRLLAGFLHFRSLWFTLHTAGGTLPSSHGCFWPSLLPLSVVENIPTTAGHCRTEAHQQLARSRYAGKIYGSILEEFVVALTGVCNKRSREFEICRTDSFWHGKMNKN